MSRSLRSLRPRHQVGLLLGLLALVAVLALAVSGALSPTGGPAAVVTSGRTPLAPDASAAPGTSGRRAHPQVGSRPGGRGVRRIPSDPPPGPVPAGVTITSGTMSYGRLQRSYLLATPTVRRSTGRLPLLIDLHGRNSTPRFAAQQSGLLPLVADGRAIALYPTGYDKSWNAGGCCGTAAARHLDDLGFLRALILRIAGRQDVNGAQLAVLGFSNGGRMALDLACSRYLATGGLSLRAVVAVESINSARCLRGPGIPTLVTAGTDDPFVGYDEPTYDPEGGRLPSAQQEVATWSDSERCDTPTTSTGNFPQETFDCTSGPLHLVTIPGGIHRWPPSIDPTIEAFLDSALTLPAA